jgi:hypothetical protein
LGSYKYLKTKRWRGKVNSLLNKKLEKVEWGKEIYLKDLFTMKRGKRLTVENRIKGNRPLVTAGYENTGIAELIGNEEQEIFRKDTITIDMFANTFFRNYAYSADDNILVLDNKEQLSPKAKIFIVSLINKTLKENFSYGRQYRMGSYNETKIKLPTKNNKIDFEFMENFIAKLEAEKISELEAYLSANGLKDYTLTNEEQKVLDNFKNEKYSWNDFNLEKLFGNSTRGRRLKSDDRISGTLPFVTAGETDEGISAFIGNNINVFSHNTITIDMFGSAKYRNYNYGGDDHIAVVHTELLQKFASIFVTSAIHKVSYTGAFNYGRNFYAKDADKLNISLPTKNKQPDYKTMEILISAIQKLVIKDVVLYANKKITTTKKVVNDKL